MPEQPFSAGNPGLMAVTPDRPEMLEDLPRRCEMLGMAGVRCVMFREKSLDDADYIALASECLEAIRRTGALFFLNERVEAAAEIQPDGVHLTWRSPGIEDARRIVGDSVRLGVSCHSLEEVTGLNPGKPDYIVYGPVFDTPAKLPKMPGIGAAALREACEVSDSTVVAIGGINSLNISEVMRQGVGGVAGIRVFFGEDDPTGTIRNLLEGMKGSCGMETEEPLW